MADGNGNCGAVMDLAISDAHHVIAKQLLFVLDLTKCNLQHIFSVRIPIGTEFSKFGGLNQEAVGIDCLQPPLRHR